MECTGEITMIIKAHEIGEDTQTETKTVVKADGKESSPEAVDARVNAYPGLLNLGRRHAHLRKPEAGMIYTRWLASPFLRRVWISERQSLQNRAVHFPSHRNPHIRTMTLRRIPGPQT